MTYFWCSHKCFVKITEVWTHNCHFLGYNLDSSTLGCLYNTILRGVIYHTVKFTAFQQLEDHLVGSGSRSFGNGPHLTLPFCITIAGFIIQVYKHIHFVSLPLYSLIYSVFQLTCLSLSHMISGWLLCGTSFSENWWCQYPWEGESTLGFIHKA